MTPATPEKAARATGQPAGPPPPADVGTYRLQGYLASGGTADVYEATDRVTGLTVALKLQSEVGSARADARFMREYQLLSGVDHPALPAVYDIGRLADGRYYIVMELIRGMSARTWADALGVPGAPHRTRRALALLVEVVDLLGALHRLGVIHGDIKPSNLRVAPGGGVHVLDLGGARFADAPAPWFAAGHFFGTSAYVAPEQRAGGDVGPAADLYSLGVTAYRLLSGVNPFAGDRDAARELHATLVPELLADVPPRVARCVARLLEKDPAARPPSAAWVREQLVAAAAPRWRDVPPARAQVQNAVVWQTLRGIVADCPCGATQLVTGPSAGDRADLLKRLAADATGGDTHVTVLWGAAVSNDEARAAIASVRAAAARGPAALFIERVDRLPRGARDELVRVMAKARKRRRPLCAIAGVDPLAVDALEAPWPGLHRDVCAPGAKRVAAPAVIGVAPEPAAWPRTHQDGDLAGAAARLEDSLARGAGVEAVAVLAEVLDLMGQTSVAVTRVEAALELTAAPAERSRLLVARAALDLSLGRDGAAGACLERAATLTGAATRWPCWLLAAAARVSHSAADAESLAAEVAAAQLTLADDGDAARARLGAWRAALLSQAHSHRASKAAIDDAIDRLAAAPHLPWLTEAAILRVGIYGRFGEVSPPPAGVAEWLFEGPAARLRVAFARAVADSGRGDPRAAEDAALSHLESLWAGMSPHHQLLWRLVPWVARAQAQAQRRRRT